MIKPSSQQVSIHKVQGNTIKPSEDVLAIEEPLEIQIRFGPASNRKEKTLAITMRTPGQDFELVTGFLLTEGIIEAKTDIQHLRYCLNNQSEESLGNVVKVELEPSVKLDWELLQRHFYTTSSCGVCGKTSIEAVQQTCRLKQETLSNIQFPASMMHALSDRLRKEQDLFKTTGGIHAAALFNPSGKLLLMQEDIGRHNAVDKLIGAAMIKYMLPLNKYIILLSGRAGFELVQKAMMAGIPAIAAVGAPSSLAVQLAEKTGITLIGFLRNERFNIYTGKSRITNA